MGRGYARLTEGVGVKTIVVVRDGERRRDRARGRRLRHA